MDSLAIIAILIALAAALFAGLTWRIAKRTMLYHVIEDIRKDYRSPEIHHAVKRLWQLYRENGKDKGKLVEKYEEIRKKDEERISGLDEQKRIEAECGTLHYQRRLVSHFYQYVAALYVNEILPKGIVFKTWSEADLRIIPEIIIPIENKLREVLHTPPLPPLDENDSLSILYRDSKE